MKVLFRAIFDTLASQPRGVYRTLVLRTLALRILALLVRDADRRAPRRAVPSPLSRLVADIRNHPETRRTIEGMAREIGQCESLFTSAFKRMTGFPPAAFIAHCRIRKAREMLANPSLTITGIARSLGYSSTAHFSSQFRLFCGMTPRDCRRSAQSR